MKVEDLAHLNAGLNATSATLLVVGYVLIRRGWWRAHAGVMIAATVVSVAFLVSYLIYHANVGSRRFPLQEGMARRVYLTILLTHTILAAAVVPLVGITLYRAIRRQWEKHRRISQWTIWVWLYVSVTGVVVYWMLYRVTWQV